MKSGKDSAIVAWDAEGHAFSPKFGDIYASREGASSQARHVFIGGNNIIPRWNDRELFSILENGFGLGTNFLTTWQAWKEDPHRPQKLCFVSIEKYPVSSRELIEFADPQVRELAKELSVKWPLRTPGVHQLDFEDGRIVLTLFFMETYNAAKNLTGLFDAYYLDGFSPSKNPQMWEKKILNEFSKHANTGATLATWCVASKVRESLRSVGFEVSRKQGFGKKSQMLVGTYNPKFVRRRQEPFSCRDSVPADQRSLLVIGAGLAGSAVAEEFCGRGWEVKVVDEGFVAACGASAIRWGIAHVQPAADDNYLFRLSREGLEMVGKRLARWPGLYDFSAMHQLARDDQEFASWQKQFAGQHPFDYPEEFLSLEERLEVGSGIGKKVGRGAIKHYGAGPVAVSQWVRKRLETSGACLIFNSLVCSLSYRNDKWIALGEHGEEIASAYFCIVASGAETGNIIGRDLLLTKWKGRLSLLAGKGIEDFDGALTGPGYVIGKDGWFGAGATYEDVSSGKVMSDAEAHRKNLAKLKAMMPEVEDISAVGFYEGIRAVAKDRLPLVGRPFEVANSQEGGDRLYVSCGLGSRGVVFADLMARIIACRIHGEPLPVEKDLALAVDVNRFASGDKAC